jgi:pimeloyl-ACP methyl ester carboxylesterase
LKLEVLDWGGSGKPIVLLAGGGDTAHVFDDFAPKLRSLTHHHVYALTRRGFGASGYEPTNDPADRLGQDVLTAIESLKLKRPILAGHSIAGAEMSWIANNYPDRVDALIYLEAGYSYAFDDGQGASVMDMMKLQAPQPPPPGPIDLASFPALDSYYERVNGFRFPEAELRQQRQLTSTGKVGKDRDFPGGTMLMTLITHPQRYSHVPVPALFIFASPHGLGTWVDNNTDPTVRAAAKAYSMTLSTLTEKQQNAVKNGIPTAHVVTISTANHFVYLSNEGVVLNEMRAFISALH